MRLLIIANSELGEMTMTSFIRISLGAAVVLSLLSAGPVAAEVNPEAAIIKACKIEYARYASRVKRGQVKATLLKITSKLSEECKKAVEATN
jgi:hypothetical protein